MREILLNTKKSLIALTIIGIASACSGVLDQPVNGKLSEDDFYKTEEDALYGLTGAYDAYGIVYNHPWPSMYLLREIISDDVNAGGSDQNDQAGLQQIDDFIHESSNPHVKDAWTHCWAAIYRANKVINKTASDSETLKRIIAEARVLRAFMYMDLVTLWGGVPLITDDVPASEFTAQVRATKQEVLSLIEDDLNAAIPDLPVKSDYSADDKFRVSKGTAQGLLGKAYLYHENWSDALTQLEAVINSNEYELEDDPMAPFDMANEFGKESLFELNYISYNGNDWANYAWNGTSENNIIVQLMGPRGDYFTSAPGDSLTGGWGFNTPTDELYDAYVDAGDTDRRQLFLESQAELVAAGGGWSNNTAWDYEGYFRRKYGHFSNQTGGPVGELNYGTNFVLLRYSDIVLMAAEAAFRDSNENDARTYLNMIRSRPGTGLPDVVVAGPALFDAIVLERRLELAFEGHRFADLVRWGLADDELTDLGFESDKNEVLPIPVSDVNSAKLTQNPNY